MLNILSNHITRCDEKDTMPPKIRSERRTQRIAGHGLKRTKPSPLTGKHEDPAENLGARLRTIRMQQGMSQRALAKKAGVPSSSVSLIEGGHVNPSVGALKRILDAAGLSLAEFFSFNLPAVEQVFFGQGELSEISRGNVSYRQVGADMSSKSLQILYETYQPGADSGRVLLSHDGEEGGLIIEGQLEVTVGSQRRVLNAGDAYLFRSTIPHRFRNTSRSRCIVVSACTPPTF